MPRFPTIGGRVAAMPGGTFTALAERLRAERERGTLIPLHVGDTCELPPPQVLELHLRTPEMHRYGPILGVQELRDRVAREVLPRFELEAAPDEVCITAGATGGLHLCLGAICDPGDEVIVLTPSWPLVFGVIASHHATPVPLCVNPSGWPEDVAAFEQRLAAAITKRTVAIYLSEPNNPVGFAYPEAFRRAVAAAARAHELWVLHDAVYMQLCWSDPAARSLAEVVPSERLFTIGSFSKVYGLAGHRVGFVVFPRGFADAMQRLITHTYYHAGIAAQAVVLAALDARGYAEEMRDRYRRGAELTARVLRARFHVPEAGAFVFLDLRGHPLAPMEVLGRCMDKHVALAPGHVFGPGFEAFARLCYTSVPPSVLEPALQSLNEVLLP